LKNLNEKVAVIYHDLNYYHLKEQFLDENFNITQYVSVLENTIGQPVKGTTAISMRSMMNNRPDKVVIAIPLHEVVTALIKLLLAAGFTKEDIVLTLNMPSFYYSERAEHKVNISRDGDVFYEVDNKKLLASSINEQVIINEVFYEKCYDFYTPCKSVTVVDIGMNVGMASIFFTTKENVNRIYAFEPFTPTYESALRNFELNEIPKGKIISHPYGLGNVNKELSAFYNKDIKGDMSIVYDNSARSQCDERINVQIVDTAEVFQSIINKHPDDKFAFKIDCEGGEYDILSRLDETGFIRKIHILTMEWHNFNERHVSELEYILQQNNFIYQVIGSRNSHTGMLFAATSWELLSINLRH